MAKSLDKDPAQTLDQSAEKASETILPLAEQLVQALCDAAGLPAEGVRRLAGEHESDYLPRVLPVVAEAIKLKLEDVHAGYKADVAQIEAKFEDLFKAGNEELGALRRRLASQRGATTKAKAKIVEMEEASKPRALGPLADAFGVDDLLTAIDGAEEIVLAFSDGARELKGVKPRRVPAEAFRLTRGRVFFTEGRLEVTGPGDPDTVTTLAGVALLVDGEQVAWSPMAQALKIGAGQTLNLAGSVVFG